MTKQMNVNVLKSLMNQSGWTHEQVITINNEYDEMVEGIAEVVSRKSFPAIRQHHSRFITTRVLSTTLKKTNSQLRKMTPCTGFGGSHLSLKSLIKTEKKSTLGI